MAVPLPLSVNVTPVGSAPVRVRVGLGVPVVVTVNDPAVPIVNVVLLALVIAGAVPAAVTLGIPDWSARLINIISTERRI